MGSADLQRYKKLLLEKRRELSSARTTLEPGCRQWEVCKATAVMKPIPKPSFRFAYIEPTVVS
jgi:hypothetical protein